MMQWEQFSILQGSTKVTVTATISYSLTARALQNRYKIYTHNWGFTGLLQLQCTDHWSLFMSGKINKS